METKKCSKCFKYKQYNCFWKSKFTKDGYHPSCKECRNKFSFFRIWRKEMIKAGVMQCTECLELKPLNDFYKAHVACKSCKNAYNNKYYKQNKKNILMKIKYNHKKEPYKLIYKWIKDRCNLKSSTAYKYYGGRGIKCLITEEEVKELWFRDKAYLLDRPSIERKNSNGNYEYSNCRFIELSDNIRKMNKETNNYKEIIQYDLDMNYIRKWNCITDAQKIYGCTIIDCLRGKTKTSKKYIWRYNNEK